MSFDETRLFSIIPVESFILKTAHFDLENHVNPAGTLVIETTAVNVANLGLPDYFVDISLLGMALVELDPDKATIRKMHSDVLTAVQSWTPELVSGAFGFVPPARCVGIINITSLLSCDATRNMFRLDCRLVLSDVVFTTDYGGLGTAFLVDEKWNNNHTKKTTYLLLESAVSTDHPRHHRNHREQQAHRDNLRVRRVGRPRKSRLLSQLNHTTQTQNRSLNNGRKNFRSCQRQGRYRPVRRYGRTVLQFLDRNRKSDGEG